MEIIATKFTKAGTDGDFMYMMTLPAYDDALFIFNDNIEHHKTDIRGAGNAVVRPWNRYSNTFYTRSAGIPTGGFYGYAGFSEIDDAIDDAFVEINELLPEYNKIIYSGHKTKTMVLKDGRTVPLLGTQIFVVANHVLEYITQRIWDLKK